MKDMKLEKELRAAGAADADVRELTKIASTLRQVSAPGLSQEGNNRIAARLPLATKTTKRHRVWRWTLASSASFAVLLLAFGVAVEKSAPNSPLYGVKQTAEHMGKDKTQKKAPATTDNKPLGVPTKPAITEQPTQDITDTYVPPASQTEPAQPAAQADTTAPAHQSDNDSNGGEQPSTHKQPKSLLQKLLFWQ